MLVKGPLSPAISTLQLCRMHHFVTRYLLGIWLLSEIRIRCTRVTRAPSLSASCLVLYQRCSPCPRLLQGPTAECLVFPPCVALGVCLSSGTFLPACCRSTDTAPRLQSSALTLAETQPPRRWLAGEVTRRQAEEGEVPGRWLAERQSRARGRLRLAAEMLPFLFCKGSVSLGNLF